MDVGDSCHRLTTGIRLGEGGERPQASQRRTSAAEAVKGANVYGTAEAVPFVQSFSSPGECTSGAKQAAEKPRTASEDRTLSGRVGRWRGPGFV